ncbi:hypothetical protein CIK05_04745 [Bdellovibrio sp. qaytius]|nr:hypothetical protein CIK05_04745 [Bdellovibrio sp. qaytius]
MKYILALTVSILAIQAHAAFKIKPGLWEIETKINNKGQSEDMGAKMQEAMKKMKPEQRAQMEKMMGSHGMGFGEKGMKVCHTDKTSTAESMVQNPKNKCTVTDKEDLADGVKFKIKCEKGNGAAEYHMTSDTSYSGWNEFETAHGKNKMEFKGKFLSADCGNVKPFSEVKFNKVPAPK